jgi:hypothetical protein
MKIQQAILQLIIYYRPTGELVLNTGSVLLIYKERHNNPVVVCFPGVTTHCGCIFTAQ